ncbi:hypothetical protein AWR27_06500 [Spirosoma montaniterrae]|uniref:Methyltransferase FkbM domain-containing protein n=2 Tax=Spirosoma montaniterrae TaxID=1178516 RepID=A0A1P9WUE2_9BACT|nr:hypothetical protein AWR27_06500 [Spirosoma montaniterrae]
MYKQYRQLWIEQLQIGTVFDIGANIGQAALVLSQVFPNATIHSFEPLPDCYETLSKLTSKLPNLVTYNLALGNYNGDAPFERNQHTVSSSMLTMASVHVANFPETAISTTVTVPVMQLDEAAKSMTIKRNLLVKIDVQGYEMQVIEGGRNTLREATIVIAETSFVPMYEGQALFCDIVDAMQSLGFYYAGAFDQLHSPRDGRLLQQDAIFLKSEQN